MWRSSDKKIYFVRKTKKSYSNKINPLNFNVFEVELDFSGTGLKNLATSESVTSGTVLIK